MQANNNLFARLKSIQNRSTLMNDDELLMPVLELENAEGLLKNDGSYFSFAGNSVQDNYDKVPAAIKGLADELEKLASEITSEQT